jgi:hypothetical protein
MTCQLTKLETALDNLKKTQPNLNAADAALLASALSLTGRHALAIFEDQRYVWPEDYQKLTAAMVPTIKIIQETTETPAKKTAKNAPEDEPAMINVGLAPNFTAGENLLTDRDDLKTALSDILQAGVEFTYNPNDIGWQWALDRANWNTITGTDLTRRIRVRCTFTEGAVGTEVGAAGTKKRRATASKVVDVVDEEYFDQRLLSEMLVRVKRIGHLDVGVPVQRHSVPIEQIELDVLLGQHLLNKHRPPFGPCI